MKAPNEDLVAYWSMASTPRGRALIAIRLWMKSALWHGVIGGSLLLKRALDFTAAACGIVVLSPLLLTVVALIKLEDRGPVFFRQTRVGCRGRLFGMWKFRSMVRDAEALKDKLIGQNEMKGGVTFKMKNDPRITRIGRFLRKYSVDELPQLWNILAGDMSLVGPRPPVPREVAEYSVEERRRLLATPGLTCFWQVGGRSEIDFHGQVRLDVQYIQSQSFWLDLVLLFKTIPAVVLGRGAC